MMQNVTSAAAQWSVHRTTSETFELAESKAAFTEQDDPVNPFTLFGNTRYRLIWRIRSKGCPRYAHAEVHAMSCTSS